RPRQNPLVAGDALLLRGLRVRDAGVLAVSLRALPVQDGDESLRWYGGSPPLHGRGHTRRRDPCPVGTRQRCPHREGRAAARFRQGILPAPAPGREKCRRRRGRALLRLRLLRASALQIGEREAARRTPAYPWARPSMSCWACIAEAPARWRAGLRRSGSRSAIA